MGYEDVVFPLTEDDKLSRIYVNVDSKVLKEFNSGVKSSEAVEMAERHYISAIYFHTLFLFATTRSRKYEVRRGDDGDGACKVASKGDPLFASNRDPFIPAVRAALRGAMA